MTKTQIRLKQLRHEISEAADVQALNVAVGAAIGVPRPEGNPGEVERHAAAYSKASSGAYFVHESVLKIAQNGLPDAWVGTARESATDVIVAAGHGLNKSFDVLGWAARECRLLADDIGDAQRQDAAGRPLLSHALELLGSPFAVLPGADPLTLAAHRASAEHERLVKAREPALQGVTLLWDAARLADDASRRFARAMHEYASEAKAGRLSGAGLSAADRIVLEEATIPGAGTTDSSVLSVVDMTRASAALTKLDPAQAERVLSMLANSKSPQERAYVLKAIAAGHSLKEVTRFHALIHPFGDNPRRLRNVLSPEETIDSSPRRWEQGMHPTCVAAATVLARAAVDPLYAVKLTTGGHPGDPKHDNALAFARRLRAEQVRVYNAGHREGARESGVDIEDITGLAAREIGTRTGHPYRLVEPDGPTARRATLTRIEAAVDDGLPVPIAIGGPNASHEILAIGHAGSDLQVYNPWGYTYWIHESDFVHNHMDKVAPRPGGHDQQMPEPYAVHLPK